MQTLGPYELFQRLGSGATAEVFLASGPNPRGSELVALKVMLSSLADTGNTREAFLREARTSALLRHKHVVEIYEVGEVGGRPFIAMELVRGWSLALLNRKMREEGASFAIDEACDIVRQAALGLHYIHEVHGPQGQALGLIHRDVSPQNLIVDEQGMVKVVDFGLAKATAQQATQTTGLKGKLRYMAPEQLKGEGLDRRIDLFALGAVLWELVCDRPLHPGPGEAEIFQQAFFNPQPHPDEVKKGLPRAVVEVLVRAVDRDRSRRFPTGQALADALAPLSGVDVGGRIAAHVHRHFERLPRTRAELQGPESSHRSTRPATLLPAPPGKVELLGMGHSENTDPVANPFEQSKTHDDVMARVAASRPVPAPATGSVVLAAPPASGVPMAPAPPRDTLTGAEPAAEARPPAPTAASASRVTAAVGILIGVSLLVGGFALSRKLFPPPPMVEELAAPPPSKWKTGPVELTPTPTLPDPPIATVAADAGPVATRVRTRATLSGKPPRKGGKGKVRFLTSEPAEVYLGKKRLGLSGDLLTFPSGRHKVEVVVPTGEKSAALEVDVVANTTVERAVTLEATR